MDGVGGLGPRLCEANYEKIPLTARREYEMKMGSWEPERANDR